MLVVQVHQFQFVVGCLSTLVHNMNNKLKSLFNTYGPRLIGALAGFVSAKLAEKNITIDPASLITIAMTIYGIVHTTADKAAPIK